MNKNTNELLAQHRDLLLANLESHIQASQDLLNKQKQELNAIKAQIDEANKVEQKPEPAKPEAKPEPKK